MNADRMISQGELSKLRWRCRRGLLENDLFIERFFNRYADGLTARLADGMTRLMDLSDNDLLDLHLAKKSLVEVDATLDTADVRDVLSMLKEPI